MTVSLRLEPILYTNWDHFFLAHPFVLRQVTDALFEPIVNEWKCWLCYMNTANIIFHFSDILCDEFRLSLSAVMTAGTTRLMSSMKYRLTVKYNGTDNGNETANINVRNCSYAYVNGNVQKITHRKQQKWRSEILLEQHVDTYLSNVTVHDFCCFRCVTSCLCMSPLTCA